MYSIYAKYKLYVFKGRKKFMKKGLSKFISTVLAACMITTGVAVVPFATTPATVYAASGISVTESKGWLESAYNGLLVIHLTQAIMLMLRSQAILAGHSLTTHLSEDILIVGEQTL